MTTTTTVLVQGTGLTLEEITYALGAIAGDSAADYDLAAAAEDVRAEIQSWLSPELTLAGGELIGPAGWDPERAGEVLRGAAEAVDWEAVLLRHAIDAAAYFVVQYDDESGQAFAFSVYDYDSSERLAALPCDGLPDSASEDTTAIVRALAAAGFEPDGGDWSSSSYLGVTSLQGRVTRLSV